jgi:selenium metabolism protein YedF
LNAIEKSSIADIARSRRIEVCSSQDNLLDISRILEDVWEYIMKNDSAILFVLTSKEFGTGDVGLGQKLMENFLLTLASDLKQDTTLFLLNSAVELAVEESNCIHELETLAQNGCEILLCTTCIEFYGLASKVKIGNVSNMKTLMEKVNTSSKVVTI